MIHHVAAENLVPGMVSEDWDNSGKTIAKITEIPRPGFKYRKFRVTFTDGTDTIILEKSKMNIR